LTLPLRIYYLLIPPLYTHTKGSRAIGERGKGKGKRKDGKTGSQNKKVKQSAY